MRGLFRYLSMPDLDEFLLDSQMVPISMAGEDEAHDVDLEDDDDEDEAEAVEVQHLCVTQWRAPTMWTIKREETLGLTLDGSPRTNYAFRGDSRTPDRVFATGFYPKVDAFDGTPILRQAYSSEQKYVVAMSANLQAAAMFSFSEEGKGWVYFLETQRAYNIAKDSIWMKRHPSIPIHQKYGTADYLNESVASHIPPEEIICAIHVRYDGLITREILSEAVIQPPVGNIIVGEIRMNPQYLLVKNNVIPKAVMNYLESISGETLRISTLEPEMMSTMHAESRASMDHVHFWEEWPAEGAIPFPKNFNEMVVVLKRLERTQQRVVIHVTELGYKDRFEGQISVNEHHDKIWANGVNSSFSTDIEKIHKIELVAESNNNKVSSKMGRI